MRLWGARQDVGFVLVGMMQEMTGWNTVFLLGGLVEDEIEAVELHEFGRRYNLKQQSLP